jgi:hypothetical protein
MKTYGGVGSVVGIATACGLDDRGVGVRVPVVSRIFSTSFTPALGTLTPEVKRQGREVYHSPPASAEVKKMWICTPTLLDTCMFNFVHVEWQLYLCLKCVIIRYLREQKMDNAVFVRGRMVLNEILLVYVTPRYDHTSHVNQPVIFFLICNLLLDESISWLCNTSGNEGIRWISACSIWTSQNEEAADCFVCSSCLCEYPGLYTWFNFLHCLHKFPASATFILISWSNLNRLPPPPH